MANLKSFAAQSAGYGAIWFVGMNAAVLARKHRYPSAGGWVNHAAVFSAKSLAVSGGYCLAIGSVVAVQTTVLGLPAWVSLLSGVAVTAVTGRLIGRVLNRPCPLPRQ